MAVTISDKSNNTSQLNHYSHCDKNRWPWLISDVGTIHFDPNFKWPKISIVTPSYNQGKFIEETIRSVVFQNYPNLEYIIIDGGSCDETISIIKKYERYIKYWVSEPDNGQSHAINKGLKECTGEIFNWLNSDDFYLPDTLYNVAKAFLDNSSVKMISGFENHIQINGSVTRHPGTFLATTLEETVEMCEITQPSTFFRRSDIKQIGSIPEDMHYIMDGEIWVKLLLKYGLKSFLKIDKPLANFRLHVASKTVSNETIDNFLIERGSIIIDLQRYLSVPDKIIDCYSKDLYKSEHRVLNRNWQIDGSIISHKRLKAFFIKKYIQNQFRKHNLGEVKWALKVLIKNKYLDLFMIRSAVKLIFKNGFKL